MELCEKELQQEHQSAGKATAAIIAEAKQQLVQFKQLTEKMKIPVDINALISQETIQRFAYHHPSYVF